MERTTLQISGMSCGHCVGAVRQALARLDGVQVEQVAVGSAAVAYDPARITPAQIAAAVEDAGYDVGPRQLRRRVH